MHADAATLADLQQRLAGQPSDDAMLQEELRGVVPIVLTATGLARMSDAPAAVGSASAPAMFSRLREVSGDYAASFLSSAALFAVAGCILLLLGPYPHMSGPSAEGSHRDAD